MNNDMMFDPRGTVVGFVKQCVYCSANYADFDSPLPCHWNDLPPVQQMIRSRELYEAIISEMYKGICPKCKGGDR